MVRPSATRATPPQLPCSRLRSKYPARRASAVAVFRGPAGTREHVGMEVSRPDGSVIACEVAGERDAAPVLLCHGLADSRLSVRFLTEVAHGLGLCIVAPDRPGVGGSDPRRLRRLVDWTEDAALVLDALRADS